MKRRMSLLLCIVMALSMLSLSACGGGPGGSSGDALDVTWWLATGEDSTYYASYEENPAVKYLETMEFNGRKVKFHFTVPVSGAELDNFNTMLMTEDYKDIMDMVYSNTSAAELYSDGVIYDLTDYIAEYMPNYSALLEEFSADRNLLYSNVDGEQKILALNTIRREVPGNFMGYLYRRDWVAKYGKNPATGQPFSYGYADSNDNQSYYDDVVFPSGGPDPVYLSDWEWMFDIFTTALNDLGVTDGYCLSTYYKGYMEDGTLFNAFGGSCPLWCRNQDGTMEFNGASESMRSYITCMNNWYSKGWLDKSFAEHTNDVAYAVDSAKIHTGKVGMWVGRRSETGNLMDAGDKLTSGIMVYGARSPINDLYGAEETRGHEPYSLYQYARIGSPRVISKSVSEEDLPTLLTMLDYFYTAEGGALLCFGLTEEQVQQTKDPTYAKYGLEYGFYPQKKADGTIEYIRNPATLEDNNLASAVAGKRITCSLYDVGFVTALNASYTIYARNAMAEWDHYLNTGHPENELLGQFSSEESARYSKVYANVDTYMATNVPKFINGSLNVNGKDWDNYCTMLNKYSPDSVTAIYQRLYNQ